MSDELTKLGEQSAKLAASLTAVAESMKTAAALAESFAALVKDSSFSGASTRVHAHVLSLIAYPGAADGDKKSKKRKGTAAVDDDAEPAKRKRKVKDPNAPKRPASSYIMFQNDIRKDLKEKNPHLNNVDLLALISQKWSEMSEEDKAVYTKANASAKEQYSNEKKAYEARSPEEVAAANAALEAAIAAKKSKPRARVPKATAPSAVAASATPATTAGDTDSDESDSDEDGIPKNTKPAALVQVSDSEDEVSEDEDDESDEEEAPKPPVKTKEVKAAKSKPAPAPVQAPEKVSKKKAAK
ncbi:hypothetical protein C0993_008100 [Termitomyces sp. T159_Od127]|nr:hypothetical protein C0993_008100 [Termitomyces sp. T159_Od127]